MKKAAMIVLFTDFGLQDPYVGQLKSVLLQNAADIPVIDLLHKVPDYNIRAAAYLLPAYVKEFPPDSIFLCVVDPGVGSSREACVAQIDQRWFIGPDNNLFALLQRRARQVRWWRIPSPVVSVAATFHGRDVFAPLAARLAHGDLKGLIEIAPPSAVGDWPADLAEVIYIDHYGNLVSGYRFCSLPARIEVSLKGVRLPYAKTFADVPAGTAFYYGNSNGLLEVAVNMGSAEEMFKVQLGDSLMFGL